MAYANHRVHQPRSSPTTVYTNHRLPMFTPHHVLHQPPFTPNRALHQTTVCANHRLHQTTVYRSQGLHKSTVYTNRGIRQPPCTPTTVYTSHGLYQITQLRLFTVCYICWCWSIVHLLLLLAAAGGAVLLLLLLLLLLGWLCVACVGGALLALSSFALGHDILRLPAWALLPKRPQRCFFP